MSPHSLPHHSPIHQTTAVNTPAATAPQSNVSDSSIDTRHIVALQRPALITLNAADRGSTAVALEAAKLGKQIAARIGPRSGAVNGASAGAIGTTLFFKYIGVNAVDVLPSIVPMAVFGAVFGTSMGMVGEGVAEHVLESLNDHKQKADERARLLQVEDPHEGEEANTGIAAEPPRGETAPVSAHNSISVQQLLRRFANLRLKPTSSSQENALNVSDKTHAPLETTAKTQDESWEKMLAALPEPPSEISPAPEHLPSIEVLEARLNALNDEVEQLPTSS